MSKRFAAIGAALALIATPALADEERGLYLGIGLGDFSSEIDNPDDLDDIDFDEDSLKLFGGYRFNPHFALQLDWVDFGDTNQFESDALGPNAVGTLPLGPIELFAKAGVLLYDVRINTEGGEVFDDSGEDPYYGLGVGFTILGKFNIRVEYEEIEIDGLDDANAAWATAQWRF